MTSRRRRSGSNWILRGVRQANQELERFLFHPESDAWQSVLRFGLGILVVLYCTSVGRSWGFFFGKTGTAFLGSEVSDAMLHAQGVFAPSLHWITSVARLAGISEEQSLELLRLVLVATGFFLVVGLFCRPSAITAWFLHLCLAKSGTFIAYGVDSAMTIGLFYLMLMPLPDRASIDAWLTHPAPSDPAMIGFFRRALQIHLCFFYFFGGLTKMLGAGWWNGTSVWRALLRPPFDILSGETIRRFQPLLPSLGIMVWLMEILYCVLIWPRRTRMFWLLIIVALHLGIALVMGLHLFALAMIVLNLAAFGPDWRLRGRASPRVAQC